MVTPRFSNSSTSRMSLSAALRSGSISARNASNSADDRESSDGDEGA